ncbi:hypothetical protein CONPUDRAFT_83230 [Coniophora puteana RWD-64-598 SS2]|uniref:Uncharacterized protein n=1 Tax=Coniophora puteana (strain RWD-64-598) TaxID=741705 RepID=A0A5M3MMY1_CONPW|nr:uncharacterized protein CONPUDRAFT_83230 [Coniophora puteana RWD-64-598 SS2]EIW80065.1 hypothetical protein CONPUDRAFT_83230 [Coniophora puteana RWD-64-598 SS2]
MRIAQSRSLESGARAKWSHGDVLTLRDLEWCSFSEKPLGMMLVQSEVRMMDGKLLVYQRFEATDVEC